MTCAGWRDALFAALHATGGKAASEPGRRHRGARADVAVTVPSAGELCERRVAHVRILDTVELTGTSAGATVGTMRRIEVTILGEA